jgi:hypothetical protein
MRVPSVFSRRVRRTWMKDLFFQQTATICSDNRSDLLSNDQKNTDRLEQARAGRVSRPARACG